MELEPNEAGVQRRIPHDREKPSVGKNTGRNSNVLAFRALRDCKHNRLKNEIRLHPS